MKKLMLLVLLVALASSVYATAVESVMQVLTGPNEGYYFTAYKDKAAFETTRSILWNLTRTKSSIWSMAGRIWDNLPVIDTSSSQSIKGLQANVSITNPAVSGYASATFSCQTDANGTLPYYAEKNARIEVRKPGYSAIIFRQPDPTTVSPVNSQNKFLAVLVVMKSTRLAPLPNTNPATVR